MPFCEVQHSFFFVAEHSRHVSRADIICVSAPGVHLAISSHQGRGPSCELLHQAPTVLMSIRFTDKLDCVFTAPLAILLSVVLVLVREIHPSCLQVHDNTSLNALVHLRVLTWCTHAVLLGRCIRKELKTVVVLSGGTDISFKNVMNSDVCIRQESNADVVLSRGTDNTFQSVINSDTCIRKEWQLF